MSTNTVATTPSKKDLPPVLAILNSPESLSKIQDILPEGLTVNEVQRTALMAVHRNPLLSECTPTSVLLAVMQAAQFGTVVDGRHAHLIPYKRNFKDNQDRWHSVMEAQFQWDYKGIVQKILDSPKMRSVHADVICENDTYRVVRGTNPSLVHEIDITKPRGKKLAAYSVMTYADGSATFEVMLADEIEAIRARSKSGNSGPWKTDEGEMWKKTVIKRHSKTTPLPTSVSDAVNADNDYEEIQPANAREIKPAAIPTIPVPQATLPAPEEQPPASEAPQATPAATAKPEKPAAAKVVETPAPKKSASLTKKASPPAPAEPAAAESAESGGEVLSETAAKAKAMLEGAGFTVQELLKVAKANDWLTADIDLETASISALDDDTLANFISTDKKTPEEQSNWEMVLEELGTARK